MFSVSRKLIALVLSLSFIAGLSVAYTGYTQTPVINGIAPDVTRNGTDIEFGIKFRQLQDIEYAKGPAGGGSGRFTLTYNLFLNNDSSSPTFVSETVRKSAAETTAPTLAYEYPSIGLYNYADGSDIKYTYCAFSAALNSVNYTAFKEIFPSSDPFPETFTEFLSNCAGPKTQTSKTLDFNNANVPTGSTLIPDNTRKTVTLIQSAQPERFNILDSVNQPSIQNISFQTDTYQFSSGSASLNPECLNGLTDSEKVEITRDYETCVQLNIFRTVDPNDADFTSVADKSIFQLKRHGGTISRPTTASSTDPGEWNLGKFKLELTNASNTVGYREFLYIDTDGTGAPFKLLGTAKTSAPVTATNAQPTITLSSIDNTPAQSKVITVAVSDTDAGDTLRAYYKLKDGNTCAASDFSSDTEDGTQITLTSNSGTITLENESDNNKYVCARVYDGTVFAYIPSDQIQGIDRTVPTITAVTVVSNNATTTLAKAGDVLTFTITASETLRATNQPDITASIGGTDITLTSPTIANSTATYTYTVQAGESGAVGVNFNGLFDAVGNAQTTAYTTAPTPNVAVDTTVPTITAVTVVSNNATTTLAKAGDVLTFTITASETLRATNQPDITASIGGTDITLTSPTIANSTATYTYTVQAGESGAVGVNFNGLFDAVGNAQTTAYTTAPTPNVAVDTTAPTQPTVNAVAGDNIINATEKAGNIEISGTKGDDNIVVDLFIGNSNNIQVYSVTNIGTPTSTTWSQTVSTTEDEFNAIFATDGQYEIYVTARDQAGNLSTPRAHNADVDTTLPTPTVTGSASETVGNTVTFTITRSEDGSALTIDYGDGTPIATITDTTTTTTTTHTYTTPSPTSSPYEVTVTETDQAGNQGTNNHSIAINQRTVGAPTVALTTDTFPAGVASNHATRTDSVTSNPSITISGLVNPQSIEYSKDINFSSGNVTTIDSTDGLVSTNTSFAITSPTGVAQGANTYYVRYTDTGSITSASASIPFTYDNANPEITNVRVASNNANTALAKAGDELTFTITANEPLAIATSQPSTLSATIGGTSISIARGTVSGSTITYTYTVPNQNLNGAVGINFNRLVDTVGNVQTRAYTRVNNVIVDTITPIIREVTAVTTPTNAPNYTFSSDEVGTIVYGGDCASSTTTTKVGDDNTITLTQPDGSTDLTERTYSNCTVKVRDNAGNESSTLTIPSFTIDRTAPTVGTLTFATNPANKTRIKATETVTATFTVSEAVTSAPQVRFNIGGGADKTAVATTATSNTDEYSVTYTVANGENGLIGFKVQALTDSAGNTTATETTSRSTTITADTQAPTITFTTAPNTTPTNQQVTFEVTIEDTNGLLNNSTKYNCGNSGGEQDLTLSGNAGSFNCTYSGVQQYTVTVKATDTSNNAETVTHQISATDTTAPTATAGTITTSNANNQYAKEGDTITIPFTTNETPKATPVVTIEGDTSATVTVSGSGTNYTATYTVTSTVPQSEIRYKIEFQDTADNNNANRNFRGGSGITADTQAPTVGTLTFATNPANKTRIKATETVTATFTVSEAVTSAPQVRFNIGGGADKTAVATTATSNTDEYSVTYTVANGENGLIGFKVQALTDSAGNTTATETTSRSTTITADTQAPTANINIAETSLSTATPSTTVTFIFSDDPGTFDADDIELSTPAAGTLTINTVAPTATTRTGTFTAATPYQGNTTISVKAGRVTDSAGNENILTQSSTITVDTQAPTITFTTAPNTTPTNQQVTFEVTIEDTNGLLNNSTKYNCGNSGGEQDLTLSGNAGSFNCTYSGVQQYTVTVKATDTSNNAETVTHQISATDTTAPTATAGTITTSNANNQYAKEGDTITIPFTTNETPKATPVVTIEGDTSATVTVSGSGTNYTATYTVTSTVPQSEIRYKIEFQDTADNNNANRNFRGGSGITADTQAPTVGTLTFATNPANKTRIKATETVTATFTVSEAVTSAPQVRFNIGGGADKTAVATTATSNTDEYSVTYTVANGENGLIGFKVQALTDSAGNTTATETTSRSTTITADTQAPTITFTTAPNTTPTNQQVTFEVTIEDTNGLLNNSTKYNCGNSGGEQDLTLSGNAGSFNCTYSGVQQYTVTVKATDTSNNAETVTHQISATDTTAPTATAGTITTSNANNQYAKEGDTITIPFTTNETPKATPVVTIEGDTSATVTVSGSGTNYTATYTVTSTVPQSEIRYKIEFQDTADNNNANRNFRGGSGITADTQAPTVSISNPCPTCYANVNDGPATVIFTFSELPTSFTVANITTNANPATTVKITNLQRTSTPANSYRANVTADNYEGAITISVAAGAYRDTTGNLGVASTGNPVINVDTLGPNPTISVQGGNTHYVGQEVSFDITRGTASGTGTRARDLQIRYADGTSYNEITDTSENVTTTNTYNAAGDYRVTLFATDVQENATFKYENLTITIDTTAPTATAGTITTSNANNQYAKEGDTITIPFTTNETPKATPVVTIEGDTSATVTVSGSGTSYTATYTVTSTVPQSEIRYKIEFQDTADNNNANRNFRGGSGITADTQAPTATISISPPTVTRGTTTATATITFLESVTGLLIGEITTTHGNIQANSLTGSGTTYTVIIENIPDNTQTTATVTVAANAAQDTAGNSNAQTTQNFNIQTLDTEAPSISGTIELTATRSGTTITKPAFVKVGDVLTLTFTTDEALQSAPTVTIAGQTATVTNSGNDYTATHTVATSTTEGTVEYTIGTLTDTEGNTSTSATTATVNDVTVDRTAPAPTLTRTDSGTLTKADKVATFTLDLGSDFNTTTFDNSEVTATNGQVAVTGSGQTRTVTYTATDDIPTTGTTVNGTITLPASAYQDIAGNNNAQVQETVTIDTQAPTATISINPSTITSGTTTATATITFSESVTILNANEVSITSGHGTIQSVTGAGPFTAVIQNIPANTNSVGTITVAANAVQDTAGNNSAQATQSFTISTVDTSSVTVRSFLVSKASDGYINDSDKSDGANYVTTTITPNISIATNYAIIAPTENCSSATYINSVPSRASITSDGTYKICTRVEVTAGTYVYGDELTLVRDILKPTLTLGTAIGTSRGTVSTPTYTFSSNDAGAITYAGSCSSSTTTAINGNNQIILTQSGGTTPLVEGTYSDCTITVTDLAGNASDSVTIQSFTIDNTAPSITGTPALAATRSGTTISTPAFVKVGDVLTLTFTTDEALQSTPAPTVTIAGQTATVTNSGNDYTATHTVATSTTEGTVEYTIGTLTDAVGNVSASATTATISNVTVDVVTPVITGSNTVVTTSTTPTYTFTSSEAGTLTVGGTCATSTTSATQGENTITFNALADSTTHDCTIKVTDSAGNESAEKAIQVVVDTTPPVVTSASIVSNEPERVTITIVVEHNNGNIAQALIPQYTNCGLRPTHTIIGTGTQTGTFENLSIIPGAYSSCTVKVKTAGGIESNEVNVSPYTVNRINRGGGSGVGISLGGSSDNDGVIRFESSVTRTLERGDTGDDVSNLNRFLEEGGYADIEPENSDTFTQTTEEALKSYQEDNQLQSTGELDRTTLSQVQVDIEKGLERPTQGTVLVESPDTEEGLEERKVEREIFRLIQELRSKLQELLNMLLEILSGLQKEGE